MNLFYLLSSIAKRGGVERTFVEKANYLDSQGHDITFVTHEQAGNPYAYPISPSMPTSLFLVLISMTAKLKGLM